MGSKKKVLACAALLAVLAGVLSLCVGAVPVAPGQLLEALAGRGQGTGAAIVLYVRLPRTAGCLAAGAALAVAGAVIQTVLANPLASPNVIGVNAGAGHCGGPVLRCGPGGGGAGAGGRFCGGLCQRHAGAGGVPAGRASRMTLILTGVALSSIFSALIDLLVTLVPDALNGYSDFRIGGMNGVTLARVGLPPPLGRRAWPGCCC